MNAPTHSLTPPPDLHSVVVVSRPSSSIFSNKKEERESVIMVVRMNNDILPNFSSREKERERRRRQRRRRCKSDKNRIRSKTYGETMTESEESLQVTLSEQSLSGNYTLLYGVGTKCLNKKKKNINILLHSMTCRLRCR